MKNFLVIFMGLVIIAILVGFLAWNMQTRIPLQDVAPTDTYAPSAQAPEDAGIDDISAEAATFDVNFDADIQQLDTELKGL